MKNIVLQYPDNTPNARILDDLTILSRESAGPKAAGGAVAFDKANAALAGLESSLAKRGIASADFDFNPPDA